jgi:polysaccharide biosynthesis protein
MKAIVIYRKLDVKPTILIDLVSQLVSLSVAVLLGWVTRSIWSFVASGLLGSVLSTLLRHVWLNGSRDRFECHRDRCILENGFSFFGHRCCRRKRRFSGWVDPAMLGYYSIAFNLATVFEGPADRLFAPSHWRH